MIKIPTSNSWWIFDEINSRYRRISRNMNPDAFVPEADWEQYCDLDIDAENNAFTVFLNKEKTRIMRGYIEDLKIAAELNEDIVAAKA